MQSDGKTTICKECVDFSTRERYQENKQTIKDKSWANSLKNKYGITAEQYNELLEKQDNRCAICDRHKDEFNRRMAVDHNHITGEIRGLLCNYCNHRVVGRHRDGDKLRKIANYIEQGTGWFIPKKKRPVKRRPVARS